jgi:hypothetical protein
MTDPLAQVKEAVTSLIELCNHGDFRNGVTDYTGSMDEGDHRAGEYIHRAQQALPALDAIEVEMAALQHSLNGSRAGAEAVVRRNTDLSARLANAEAALREATAELIYLREYGKLGAKWEANESKDVWRARADAALSSPASPPVDDAQAGGGPTIDDTNHHNALLCPYCNPKGLKFEATAPDREGRREGLEEAALRVDALHKEFAATAARLKADGEAAQLKEVEAEMCALEYARGCIRAFATGKE